MASKLVYHVHLDHGNYIRLLQLEPGRKRDPLKAVSRTVSLSRCPAYEAVSYTWGDCFDSDHASWTMYQSRLARYSMGVDGSVTTITRNLHDALMQFRYSDKPRMLWVDAVCIDQNNEKEKAWQIGHMREIYGEAAQVLVWLGISDADSDVALSALQAGYRYHLKARPHQTVGALRVDLPPAQTDQEFEDQMVACSFGKLFGLQIESRYTIPEYPIEAVAKLFSRNYWGRGWCWQEFVVPKKVTMVCGEFVLPDGDRCMQTFMATWDRLKVEMGQQPRLLDHRPWPMHELRRSYHNIRYLQDTGFQDDPDIVTPEDPMPSPISAHENPNMTAMGKAWTFRSARSLLLMKSLLAESSISWLQTSHQEDQIYALVGMSMDAKELGIQIDYSASWDQVYTNIAMVYLERGNLWCLHFCQGVGDQWDLDYRHRTVPTRSSHLPSWAPDWSHGFRGALVSLFYRTPPNHLGSVDTGGLLDKPEVIANGRLRLKGILVDEITWVSAERPSRYGDRYGGPVGKLHTRSRMSLWLRGIVSALSHHPRRTIWTTIIMNANRLPISSDPRETQSDEAKRLKLDDAFDCILENTSRRSDIEDVLESFQHCFLEAMNFKRLFETRDGRLGVAHAGVGVRDRIVVFASSTAFVLRRVVLTSERSRHRIVCESYVNGLMEDQDLKATALVEDIILE